MMNSVFCIHPYHLLNSVLCQIKLEFFWVKPLVWTAQCPYFFLEMQMKLLRTLVLAETCQGASEAEHKALHGGFWMS